MWTPLWGYAYESTQLILNYAYKATQWILQQHNGFGALLMKQRI